MKYYCRALAVIAFALTGNVFSQTNTATIYRITFSEREVSDKASMYSTRTNLDSRKEILLYFTNAPKPLTERDVIIMHIENHGQNAEPVTQFRWSLASACKASGAALYDFDCSGVVTNRQLGIREMSVLHWKSPYEDPRSLSKTEFYFDEKFTGIGETGLISAMTEIGKKKPKYLGMAGSQYTIYSSYGPDERPFGKLENAVYSCLKTNGAIEVFLCADYVWFAKGEDFYHKKAE